MFKTIITVNKRKKNLLYNFYFRQTAILILYFFNFNPLLLLFSSFFPTFFVLILSYLSGTCTFVFADISGRAELSLLFWTLLSGTYFPGVGGGGARAPSAPPLRTRLLSYAATCLKLWHSVPLDLSFITFMKLV